MGFLKTMTGMQSRALSVGTSDAPALPQGANLSFDLSPMPCYDQGLAYYLPGFFCTLSGTLTQSGGTGTNIPQQILLGLLLDSISLNNAKTGTPLSPNFVKGYWMPVIGWVGGGYSYGVANLGAIPAGNGTYGFNFSFFIPLCAGNGDRPHHTMQLQCMYRKAQLVLQFLSSTNLAAYSPGATLGATTVRVSGLQLPEGEIRVGPAVEWIDYQTPASSGQTEVKLQSFGNTTQLVNTEQGAGVAFLMAMGSLGIMPGAFNPANLTQLQIPFRGQIQTTHVNPVVVNQQLASMGIRRMLSQGQAFGVTVQPASDIQDFPWQPTNVPTTTFTEMTGLMGLTLVPQSENFETSKIQVVNGDTSYYLTLSSGPTGTHHTLCQHIRSWTPQMWADAEKEIVDSGVRKAVYGSTPLKWQVKTLYGKDAAHLSAKKLRFLPMVMKPVSSPAPRHKTRVT